MFSALKDKIGGAISKFRNPSMMSEADIKSIIRDIRMALLDSDVALPVVKKFSSNLLIKMNEAEIRNSTNPYQKIITITESIITELLGEQANEIYIKKDTLHPTFIMMVGLQGSGKTTSTAKLALLFKKKGIKVLLVSLDVYRPAAMKQLQILGEQIEVDVLDTSGKSIKDIVKSAKDAGQKYNAVILDTAGRTQINTEMMDEVLFIKDELAPAERILVADSMLGQESVNIASTFNNKLKLTGIILTKIDGDTKGGAAISMKSVTNVPIKYLCTGEKITEIEIFHPDRISKRILDMGDITSLMEKANEAIGQDNVDSMAKKVKDGKFDLNDMESQLKAISKMGGIMKLINLMPGNNMLKDKILKGKDDNKFKRQLAILLSMTKKEKNSPEIINFSRKKRIAAGSGSQVSDINSLLKQHKQVHGFISQVTKMDKGKMKNMEKMMSKNGMGMMPGGMRTPK